MSVFSSFGAWLVSLFSKIGQGILAFVAAGAEQIAKNGGAVLTQAALAAVKAAEAQGGSGKDKLEAAQAAVIDVLQKNGIPVAMSAVNFAIEAAVAQLRKGA